MEYHNLNTSIATRDFWVITGRNIIVSYLFSNIKKKHPLRERRNVCVLCKYNAWGCAVRPVFLFVEAAKLFVFLSK